MTLSDYVYEYTQPGPCKCITCNGAIVSGHTADMYHFYMSKKGDPNRKTFRELTAAHKGHLARVNPFDGDVHSYIELGGWLIDQRVALIYMGLGVLLGCFDLITPKILDPDNPAIWHVKANGGLITIQYNGKDDDE